MKTTSMVCIALALGLAAGCRNTAIVLDETARGLDQARPGGQFVLKAVSVNTPNLDRGSVDLNHPAWPAPKNGKPDKSLSGDGMSLFRAIAEAAGGEGRVSSEADRLMEWLVSGSPDAEVFRPAEDRRRKSVGAKVRVSGRETDSAGFLASVNNILSAATLSIWPRYESETYTYDVSATLAGNRLLRKEVSFEQRSLNSLLPLGLIPVPALADARGDEAEDLDRFERKLVRRTVASLFTEEVYEQALKEGAATASSDRKDGGAN